MLTGGASPPSINGSAAIVQPIHREYLKASECFIPVVSLFLFLRSLPLCIRNSICFARHFRLICVAVSIVTSTRRPGQPCATDLTSVARLPRVLSSSRPLIAFSSRCFTCSRTSCTCGPCYHRFFLYKHIRSCVSRYIRLYTTHPTTDLNQQPLTMAPNISRHREPLFLHPPRARSGRSSRRSSASGRVSVRKLARE